MLESLVDIIDKIDDDLGDEKVFVNVNHYNEHFSKYLSQVILEKSFNSMIDKASKDTGALKFELYALLTLLSKGSFEAKINSN